MLEKHVQSWIGIIEKNMQSLELNALSKKNFDVLLLSAKLGQSITPWQPDKCFESIQISSNRLYLELNSLNIDKTPN